MWRARLDNILSASREAIALDSTGEEPFRGRYLRLGERLCGLGKLVAQGAEAIVYELIDLDTGVRVGVAKICRYPPGTEQYRVWAVPYRLERNPASTRPDVEMRPAVLVAVPGGLIKLQEYVPEDPWTDWSMREPVQPVLEAHQRAGTEEALRCTAELLRQHGSNSSLLGLQGRLLCELERWEDARDSLESALAVHQAGSRADVLQTGLLLAHVHRMVYEAHSREGADLVITLDVPGGPTVRQVIYANPQASAADDTLEDRALYTLFEILDLEPSFIPGLLAVAEQLAGSQFTVGAALEVLDAVERFAPGREVVRQRRRELEDSQKRYLDHLARIAVKPEANDSIAHSVGELPREDPNAPVVGARRGFLQQFDAAYKPEPARAQLAHGRYLSVWANLSAGRYEDAEHAAMAAVKLDPSNVSYPLALAAVFEAMGRRAEHVELIHATIAGFPDRPEPLVAAGELALQNSEVEAARVAFLRASRLELEPGWRTALGLGQCHRRLGQRDMAVDHLRRALATVPRDDDGPPESRRIPWRAHVALQLAYTLRDQRLGATEADISEAMQVIDDALGEYPDTPDLLFARAQSHVFAGRLTKALEDLDRAASLAPNYPAAANFAREIRKHLEEG